MTFSQPSFPVPEPESGTSRAGHPRWYFLYFLLATFDVVTVSTSLFLSHRLTGLYEQGVTQNQESARRLADLSTLRSFAGAVNAPGNDVFDTLDVESESRRARLAMGEFERYFGMIQKDYGTLEPGDQQRRLLGGLGQVSAAANEMSQEADRIFSLIRARQPDRAAQRMATMDRSFASINAALTAVERTIRDTQAAQLAQQAAQAAELHRVEKVVACFVILMIGGVMTYGHAMSKALREAAEERERQISALQLSEALTRSIVQSASDGILTFDELGIVHSANPALARLLDSSAGALTGQRLDSLIPELRQVPANGIAAAVAGANPSGGESEQARTWNVRTPAGEERTVELAVAEIPAAAPDRRLFSAVMRDVTASRQTALSLERAKVAAEEASLAKSAFLANMSHELRTPLNAIIGYSEMLLEVAGERNDAELSSDLGRIRVAGKHLLGLINDILDLSKIEAGRTTVDLQPVDVRLLMAEVESTAKPLAAKRNNVLRVEVPADIGWLVTDALKLRQILLNLVGNACKFTAGGTVSVSVVVDRSGARPTAEFGIEDSGIGISAEQLGRLFKSFTQADASTTRKFGGTGLGLAISKGLAGLLGGEIVVSSRLGVGSRFAVRLPLVAAADEDVTNLATALTADSGGGSSDSGHCPQPLEHLARH